MSDSYEILSDDTIENLHNRFMNSVDKRVARLIKKSGVKESNDLKEAVREAVLLSHRWRVKSEADDHDFVNAIQDFSKGNVDSLKQFLDSVKEIVNNREERASRYSMVDLPEVDKEKHNEARKKRSDPQVVEGLFQRKDRVYIRMPEEVSKTQKAVKKLLSKQPEGYKIIDWSAGKATDAKGKQVFKIGKILSKLDEKLYTDFQNDLSRTCDKMIVVLSRDPDDIARASTNRGWGSCAGAGSLFLGAYAHMSAHIQEGGLIAYLTSENDPDIHNPMARIMIKPFEKIDMGLSIMDKLQYMLDGIRILTSKAKNAFNSSSKKDTRLYVVGKTYGLGNELFVQTVCSVVNEKLNGYAKSGFYEIIPGLYTNGVEKVAHADRKVIARDKWGDII